KTNTGHLPAPTGRPLAVPPASGRIRAAAAAAETPRRPSPANKPLAPERFASAAMCKTSLLRSKIRPPKPCRRSPFPENNAKHPDSTPPPNPPFFPLPAIPLMPPESPPPRTRVHRPPHTIPPANRSTFHTNPRAAAVFPTFLASGTKTAKPAKKDPRAQYFRLPLRRTEKSRQKPPVPRPPFPASRIRESIARFPFPTSSRRFPAILPPPDAPRSLPNELRFRESSRANDSHPDRSTRTASETPAIPANSPHPAP